MPITKLHKQKCLNKKGFGRIEKAEAEIYRSHRGDALMVPYFCPFCRNWHIGHRRKGKAPR